MSAANQRLTQRRDFENTQRLNHQNQVGALYMNAINTPLPKPQMDDGQGNMVDNPAYHDAVGKREALMQQYAALTAPHQQATFGDHLHGLIFDTPKHETAAPLPEPEATAPAGPQSLVDQFPPVNGETNELGASLAAPARTNELGDALPNAPAAPAQPMHPFVSHPALAGIHAGLDALRNHLQAAANPVSPNQPDFGTLAQSYTSPLEQQYNILAQKGSQAQQLQALKNQGQVTTAEIRVGGIRGQAGHPLDLASASGLADEGQAFIDKNTGKPIDFDELRDKVPNAQITPYYQGQRLLGYEVSDSTGRPVVMGNQLYRMDKFGNVDTSQPIGVKNLGTTHSNSSTDQYGNTTSSSSTTTPVTGGPVSSNAPVVPLTATNAAIAAGNATSKKLNKGKPVSANAPVVPVSGTLPVPPAATPIAAPSKPIAAQNQMSLDENGQIPDSAGGNPQVRQFAQDLIDDRDVDKIPQKARASAEALARQFGWSQGAFTPREQKQMLVSESFLTQFKDSPSMKVLDDPTQRFLIGKAFEPSTGILHQIGISGLSDEASDFIRKYNAALGTIQGLGAVTRQGKATEAAVERLKTELPSVLQSKNAADGRARIDQLLKEVSLAQQSNKSLKMKNGDNSSPVTPRAPEQYIRVNGKLVPAPKTGGQ